MTHRKDIQEIFQKGMTAFINEDFEASIAEFSRTIEADPDFGLAYMSRGAALLKLDRLDESIVDFNTSIELDPKHPKPYHLRGLVKEKSGDTTGALEDFSRAIDLDPGYGSAYYSRATLHVKLGYEDMATEDIDMVNALTERNIQEFAHENNIWRSRHLRLEQMGVADPMGR